MLEFRYEMIKTIAFSHDYYSDQRSRDFEIIPTDSCSRILEENDLLFRFENGQGILFQKKEQSGGIFQPAIPLTGRIKLVFKIYCVRPHILGITDMAGISAVYLTNRKPGGTLQNSLTKSSQLSADDKLPAPGSQRQSLSFEAGLYKKMVLKHLESNKTILYNILPGQETQEIVFPQDGIYTIQKEQVNGVVAEQSLYISDEVASAKPVWAVLELFLDASNAGQENFNIALKASSTPWIYFFIDIKEKEIDFGTPADLSMQYKATTTALSDSTLFSRLEPTAGTTLEKVIQRIKSSDPARIKDVIVFQSTSPLSISEKEEQAVSLHKSVLATPVVKKLPMPVLDEQGYIQLDNQLFSTIFFNI